MDVTDSSSFRVRNTFFFYLHLADFFSRVFVPNLKKKNVSPTFLVYGSCLVYLYFTERRWFYSKIWISSWENRENSTVLDIFFTLTNCIYQTELGSKSFIEWNDLLLFACSPLYRVEESNDEYQLSNIFTSLSLVSQFILYISLRLNCKIEKLSDQVEMRYFFRSKFYGYCIECLGFSLKNCKYIVQNLNLRKIYKLKFNQNHFFWKMFFKFVIDMMTLKSD